jgi:hypothetical protein
VTQRSLTSDAEAVTSVEDAEPLQTSPDVQLGASLGLGGHAASFAPRKGTTHVRCHDLREVLLRDAVLFKNGEHLRETGYLFAPDELRDLEDRLDDGPVLQGPADLRTVIAVNRSSQNYYHWLTQALPAVDLAVRIPAPEPFCLAVWRDGDAQAGFQADSLRLLGHADLPRLELDRGRTCRLPKARFCDLLDGHAAFAVSRAMREVHARLASAVRDMQTGHDAIYVARTDSRHRRMTNEPELIELMLSYGVSVVVAGQMSLAQQINLFRNARVVIGPHGAGLTNIVFCRPGAVVYELLQANYPNACMNVLAQGAGLAYRADMFPPNDAAPNVHDVTWTAALDVVEQRLATIPGLAKGRRGLLAAPHQPAPQQLKRPVGGSSDGRLDSVVTYLRALACGEPEVQAPSLERLVGQRRPGDSEAHDLLWKLLPLSESLAAALGRMNGSASEHFAPVLEAFDEALAKPR